MCGTREIGLKMLEVFDPEMAELYHKEEARQRRTIDLVASQNVASSLSTCLEGSLFTNKNMVGYPDSRFTGGCEYINRVELLSIQRLKALFGCEYANVQAVNATIANIAVLMALMEPGDTLLSLDAGDGGHISHGDPSHINGMRYHRVAYHLDRETERVDMEDVARLARLHRPKVISCGFTAYTRTLDYARFAEIAREVGAYLWVDCAHESGLIAAKVVPSPVPYADVVTFSTQKTLRGPRGGGIILCRQALAKKIDQAVYPTLQAGSKTDMVAARAVLFQECGTPEFRAYGKQVLANAQALARGCQAEGLRLVSGGTDNHMVLLDVTPLVPDGQAAEDLLYSVGIVANKISIPFVTLSSGQPAGLRIGSPAMTTRGAKEAEMEQIGRWIGRVLRCEGRPEEMEAVRTEAAALAGGLPLFAEEWLPASCREIWRSYREE